MAMLLDMVFNNTMPFNDAMRHISKTTMMPRSSTNPHYCCLALPPLPPELHEEVHNNIALEQAALLAVSAFCWFGS
jgi:hypothetical protein